MLDRNSNRNAQGAHDKLRDLFENSVEPKSRPQYRNPYGWIKETKSMARKRQL